MSIPVIKARYTPGKRSVRDVNFFELTDERVTVERLLDRVEALKADLMTALHEQLLSNEIIVEAEDALLYLRRANDSLSRGNGFAHQDKELLG